MTEIVDRTTQVYAGVEMPASVREGKQSLLRLLSTPERSPMVKKIEFLENFGQNVSETARAGEPRYTGLVVSLNPDFKLRSDGADAAWLNGLYGESVQIFPTAEKSDEAKLFVALTAKSMKPSDSRGVAGIYRKTSQDEVTGETQSKNFIVVNTSAAEASRNLTSGWTSDGASIKDAYESAATAEYMGCLESKDGLAESKVVGAHDNLKAFTESKLKQLGKKFKSQPAESAPQSSNVFLRGSQGLVHYLNGAVAASSEHGALCLVSPLHGYVKFRKTGDRTFFPSTLLSADRFVDVANLNPKQQKAIFDRAVWPKHTTCNSFALRKPIQNWAKALPQPQEVYRMAKANFSLDTMVHQCLPTAALLAMTPELSADSANGSTAALSRYPKHVQEGKVQIADTDRLCARLLSLRGKLDTKILNPAFYNEKRPGVLEVPRNIAVMLAEMQ